MTDTTTIEITKDQRERLRDVNSGSAKAAVDDLLDAYENTESVDLAPILERLDRIEAATKEATNAAQAAEKSVNDLTNQR